MNKSACQYEPYKIWGCVFKSYYKIQFISSMIHVCKDGCRLHPQNEFLISHAIVYHSVSDFDLLLFFFKESLCIVGIIVGKYAPI